MTVVRMAWMACVLVLAGCTSVPFRETAAPRGSREDQEIADRFLAHWNQNAKQINSVVCRAVDVSGSSEGQSYTLDAMLAFQEPNSFRLTGKFLGKHEADLGSNDGEVWFWMARAKPPAVYFCKREDLPKVSLPMPFHPDDLIQVLGSVPLDPNRFRFERGWDQFVTLVSSETAPSGDPVVKRIVVDRATGRAARFEVWDLYSNQPRKLAEAEILRYHEDPSGVFVPQKVKLRFPAAQTDLMLTMRSRSIEINQIDSEWAANLFSRGNYVNSQVVDLGEEYRRRQASLDRPPLARSTQTDEPPVPPVGQEIAAKPVSSPSVRMSPDIQQVGAYSSLDRPETQGPASEPTAPLANGLPTSDGLPQPFEGIKAGGYQPRARTQPGSFNERFN